MRRITPTAIAALTAALAGPLAAGSLLAAPARPAAPAAAAPEPAGEVVGTPKPTAPIAIEHEFLSSPRIGLPLELALSVRARAPLADVEVRFAADDPLAMIEPLDAVALGALGEGESTPVRVTVLPLKDETHYLSISVTAVIDGVVQTRSVAVPIRGAAAPQAKPAAESSNAGERVRSFEAVETTR